MHINSSYRHFFLTSTGKESAQKGVCQKSWENFIFNETVLSSRLQDNRAIKKETLEGDSRAGWVLEKGFVHLPRKIMAGNHMGHPQHPSPQCLKFAIDFQDHMSLAIWLISIFALLSLLSTFIFLCFARYLKLTEKPLPPFFRTLGTIGLIVTLLLIFGGRAGWQWYQNRPTDKVTILVADFDGPEPKKYRVTENLLRELQDASHAYKDMEIRALGKTITEQEGSDKAREESQRSTIMLWGNYGLTSERVQITLHFEIPRGYKFFPIFGKNIPS